MDGVMEFFEAMYDKLEAAGVYSFIDKACPYVIGAGIGMVILLAVEWWESGLPLKTFLLETMFVIEEEEKDEDDKEGGQIDRA